MKQMKLVGNETVSGVDGDHLSDHFGIAILFEVAHSSVSDTGTNQTKKLRRF